MALQDPSPDGAGRKTGRIGRFFAPLDLASLAEAQHGVVSLGQLEELGLSESAVQKRATAGRLFRIHQGVYALTPRSLLPREGHWMAAVLAGGPDAALSHRSAAVLHELRSD